MKKRVLSVFLAVAMTVCIIPLGSRTAYAADDVPWSDLLLDAEKWINGSCDISVESEQKIRVKSDAAGDEEYNLLKKTNTDVFLLMSQKEKILQTISLDVLANHFDNCTELMHILTNAVSGIWLSSTVTRLKDSYDKTNDTALVVISSLKSGTDITISDLIQVYKYYTDPLLIKSKTNGAAMGNKTLSKIQLRSDNNFTQIKSLVDLYGSNEIVANDMLRKIMDEFDLDSKKQSDARAEMDAILKKIDFLDEQKDALRDKICEYSKRYTDFSYDLPGQNGTVIKAAATSSVYGGVASMFGLPEDDAALISKQQESVQTAYTDVMQEMISLMDKIANTSASSRDVEAVVNAIIAMRCCMRLMEVYLVDLSSFWENLSTACQNMSDRFGAVAEAFGAGDNDTYISFFKESEFIEAYLLYMVNLAALNRLSIDALDDFYSIREKGKGYMEEADPKTHWERASKGAAALSVKMKDMKNQSLYSGTVINEQTSSSLTIVIVCGALVLCVAAALIISKKKKKPVLSSSTEQEIKEE